MSELAVDRPNTVVITGTHSAGKSTLLSGVELGKLAELGIEDLEYPDFGYGLVNDADNTPTSIVTVPESARWLAVDIYDRPDFLAENYSLAFQLSIDAETIHRIHSASTLGPLVTDKMVSLGIMDAPSSAVKPIVVSDRGPLDGVIYSESRCQHDTNVVFSSPRTGFITQWMRSYIDHAVVVDHTEVPFEIDDARLNDINLRDTIADSILANYRHFMPEAAVTTIDGTQDERRQKLIAVLTSPTVYEAEPEWLPYSSWSSVTLAQ